MNGPVYIRMLRGEIPRLFDKSEPMIFGKARLLSRGNDITLLSSGICTEEAIRAAEALKNHGISITHLHISTLKPFSDSAVLEALSANKYGVITMENHTIIGGLGSIAAEKMAEHGISNKLLRIGIKDAYLHGAGREYLMKEYGIDAAALINAVEGLTDSRFNITEDDLKKAHITPIHSDAKAEAL
jgi:transketolase